MPDLLIALMAAFGAVALVSGSAISYFVERRAPTRRRLMTVAAAPVQTRGVLAGSPLVSATLDPALKRMATYIPKSPKEMSAVQRKLAAAGYHGTEAVVKYCAAEVVLAAIGLVAPLILFGPRGFMFGVGFGILGYVLPSLIVQRLIARRKLQIQNGLPDALDLLIVCVEAGLGIDQAILKTAEELSIAYPALGDELRMVNVETRAGKPRIEAFKNFSRRTMVEDVRSLVAMLVQTDRFGTSIAQALRTHAEVSRTKRRQRAEEKAAKLGVKLVFPLVFCLLPAFFVVSLGAAIIKLAEFFSNARNAGFGGF